ncbi:uncharacterized protein LOC100202995 isoform X2 [Hydra vulgaris]|uniref:Uncharacterized protein LOC100202995 isoform X2 n=1 Tax=Hydra vulgaris TaxID=6087 RepID=A0ABM4D894_HYDVU
MYCHIFMFCTLLIGSNCKKKKPDKEFSIANLLSGMDPSEQLMFKEELEKEVKKFHVPGSQSNSKAGVKRSKVKEKTALNKAPTKLKASIKQTKQDAQKALVGICDPICAHQCVHGCDFRCCIPGYQAAKHIPRPPITVVLPGSCSPICSPTCFPECSSTCCAGGAGGMFQSNTCPYGCSSSCYPSCTLDCCLLEIKKNFPSSPPVSQVPYYVQPPVQMQPPQPQNYLALNQQLNYVGPSPIAHASALTSPLRNSYPIYQLAQPRIPIFQQKPMIFSQVNRFQPFNRLSAVIAPVPTFQNLCVPVCRSTCTPQCPIQCCGGISRDIEAVQLRQNFPIVKQNQLVCQPLCQNFCYPNCPKRCCILKKNQITPINSIFQSESITSRGPPLQKVTLDSSSNLKQPISNITVVNNTILKNITQNCCEPHNNDKKSKIAKQLELLK